MRVLDRLDTPAQVMSDLGETLVQNELAVALVGDQTRYTGLARSVLFDIPLLSVDEMLERVDAVTADEVAELANEVYDPARLAAACVGADTYNCPSGPNVR